MTTGLAHVSAGADGETGPRGTVRPATFGRIVAALVFVVTLPLWPLAAAVVWASVGRPLLFRQVRSGLAMQPFTICKFRTMSDRRGTDGALLPDAMRETSMTRLMRLSRIDELPQLLAVARGDMAFVGPRPLLPATVAGFGDLGRLRCAVPPGLTGWAQVNGNTHLTERQKLALDLWYVKHRSIALDFRILAMTAMVIFRGERIVEKHLAQAETEMEALQGLGAGETTQ